MSETAKITITLESETADFIRSEVERGAATSPEGYVEDLVRRDHERDQARRELDAALQRGLDDVQAGRTMSLDDAFDSVFDELGWERIRR
ncbi:type II toxin-antitoxin system ParD family antitoxin [Neorhizobium sp. JUb45]|uniref:ribbon-helix-helix domain-containing protein n=1 Tax=unclassified Neorhizobium TaxID=2629175 RepID=UPI00104601F5|nr:type II toxin-antitoxin system ParD family antitoxin [Neorhizobium sp. JUb45]TCR01010.1 antitoxin ParD1/3/4 [Neorhizobium sp. JUb45]